MSQLDSREARRGERHRIDEMLEAFVNLEEDGVEIDRERLVRRTEPLDPDPESLLDELLRLELLESHGSSLELSTEGRSRATAVIRRHRLAEILFAQVLEVPDQDAEESACEMEHILSSGVTDSVCTFLGHPPRCPHGRPIPAGECCKTFQNSVAPLVMPLTELDLTHWATVVFISSPATARLTRLADLGLAPGARTRLLQRSPAFVVAVGETSLALEREIAREIYVRRES